MRAHIADALGADVSAVSVKATTEERLGFTGDGSGIAGPRCLPDRAIMSGAAGLPAWYWERGLHDAQLLSAELQDDTLALRLDSRSALFDNTVSQITFLGARLKNAAANARPPDERLLAGRHADDVAL